MMARRLLAALMLGTALLPAAAPAQTAAAAGHQQDWQAADLAQLAEAARGGVAAAQYALALRLQTGTGVLQNFTQAAAWMARAAEQGHAAAQNRLGQYYHTGLGVAQDSAAALRWLEQAAAGGEPQHLFDLAAVLEQQPGGAARAAEFYRQAADQGHADAAVSLGVLYQAGTGVAQDLALAQQLYEGAAGAGHARGQNNLGLMFVRGEGVVQDYARAAALFQAAAEQGLPVAMGNLGVMYENGFGVALDESLAAELYRRAGRGGGTGGERLAAQMPGAVFDARLQPPGQDPEALARLRSGVQGGDPLAQFLLAWLTLQQPEPGPEGRRQAARLLAASAAAGYPAAMGNLALMYFDGRGLPQDYVLGYMWLVLAGSAGLPEAPGLSAELALRMTPGQLAEAQALAQERATALGLALPVLAD